MSASDRTRVLLGVTGGIAAYKSPDVVRRLAERGADVQVAMTAAAKQFVTPLTFQAVSGHPTRDDLWDSAAEAAMGHIELARWAELVLIAPASADFIARLAHGRADDLLSTLCLATDAPIAVAPAMNRLMWANPATQANIAILRERGIAILGPAEGDQACGEVGPGRMLEPDDLAERALQLLARSRELAGVHIVITAGPTREAIDPVRFISNRSSGKMGFATAQAARALGAKVTLISGPVSIDTPLGVRRIDVESAQDMYDAVHRELPTMDIFISAAAVADYRPPQVQAQKIKKSGDTMHLDLVKAPDILSSVSAHKRRPFVVGFAAETERVEQHAREKLLKKNLDMIAANLVGEGLAFDCDDNALLVLWPGGSRTLERAAKSDIARQLVALIVERFRARAEQSTRQRANV
jgi:phosphopantothenoylcysteine decarboxylase/phosphopantothenate--cysteine ligase